MDDLAYNILQFLHVAAAVVWVGSGFGLTVLLMVIGRASDYDTLAGATRHMEVLGSRLFGPAAGLTLLFGIVAVLLSDGRVGFTEPWIVIGFAGFAASALITVFANPIRARMAKAAAEHGPQHPDVSAGMARTRILNTLDLLVLFIVIGAMVIKPGAQTVI